MQTVYIELIFFDNFIMDLIILLLMLRVTEKRVRIWRAALGALIGGIYAVIAVMIYPLRHILMKTAVSLLMAFAAHGFRSLRSYLLSVACFYGFSMLAAGGILLAEYAFGENVSDSFINLPILRYIAIGAAIAVITAEFMIRRKQLMTEHTYIVTARFGSTAVILKAILDTGNSVTDNAGNGVIIADMTAVLSQLDMNEVCSMILSSEKRFICTTAAGETSLRGIHPDNITINDGKRTYYAKGYIALSENIDLKGHSALLPYNMRLI